jgi:hypothetical protein
MGFVVVVTTALVPLSLDLLCSPLYCPSHPPGSPSSVDDGASDSKMKNLAIWSKTVIEDTGMMVFTAYFGTDLCQGVKNAPPQIAQ